MGKHHGTIWTIRAEMAAEMRPCPPNLPVLSCRVVIRCVLRYTGLPKTHVVTTFPPHTGVSMATAGARDKPPRGRPDTSMHGRGLLGHAELRERAQRGLRAASALQQLGLLLLHGLLPRDEAGPPAERHQDERSIEKQRKHHMMFQQRERGQRSSARKERQACINDWAHVKRFRNTQRSGGSFCALKQQALVARRTEHAPHRARPTNNRSNESLRSAQRVAGGAGDLLQPPRSGVENAILHRLPLPRTLSGTMAPMKAQSLVHTSCFKSIESKIQPKSSSNGASRYMKPISRVTASLMDGFRDGTTKSAMKNNPGLSAPPPHCGQSHPS